MMTVTYLAAGELNAKCDFLSGIFELPSFQRNLITNIIVLLLSLHLPKIKPID